MNFHLGNRPLYCFILGPLFWERLHPGGGPLPDTLSTGSQETAYLASDTSSTGGPESVPSQRHFKYW